MGTLWRLLRKVPCVIGMHTWKLVYVDDEQYPLPEPIRIACMYCGKAP